MKNAASSGAIRAPLDAWFLGPIRVHLQERREGRGRAVAARRGGVGWF